MRFVLDLSTLGNIKYNVRINHVTEVDENDIPTKRQANFDQK